MGNYKLSAAAESDLKRIAEFGEAQADAYYYKLLERFEQLANQPYIAPAVDDIRLGYRRAVCGVDGIYYRIHGDYIEIMRVLGRQDAQLNL